MSGRKSSEVAQVLRSSEQGRAKTLEDVEDALNSLQENFEQINQQIDAKLKQMTDGSFEFSEELQREFPDRHNELRERHRDLKTSCAVCGMDKADLDTLLKEHSALNERLARADKQADVIRRSIRGKNWYCNEEYAQACELAQEYKAIFNSQLNLMQKGQELERSWWEKNSLAEEHLNLYQNLADELNSANELAKKRRESNVMRTELRKLLASLDQEASVKFFGKEQEDLSAKLERAMALDDEQFMAQFEENYKHAADYQNKLNVRIARWQREKMDAEQRLAKLAEAADFQMVEPLDLYRVGEEEGAKIGLLKYLADYGKEDKSAEYADLYKEISDKITAEDFSGCTPIFEKAEKLLSQVREKAFTLRESMYNSACLAVDMQDIMDSLGWDTKLELAGDNPADGFRLLCTVGEESIDFDTVKINNDGEIVVKINHKEAIGGTCGTSWQQISTAMRENDIPITDIKYDGGGSIFGQRVKLPGKRIPEGERERG